MRPHWTTHVLSAAAVLAAWILLVGISASVAFAQEHNAHWYNKDAQTGRFSVIVNVPDGTQGIVAVTREKGVNTTVVGIGTDLSFQRKVLTCTPIPAPPATQPGCFPPSILLGIDKDMNGRYEADDFAWQWSLVGGGPGGANSALLHGDTFLQCENTVSLTGPDATFVSVDAYSTYFCFHPNAAGTDYNPTHYAPLSAYQLGLGTADGITTLSGVLALKVLAGGAGSWMDFSALVDLVTMGNMMMMTTRIDEPNNSRSHFEVDVP